MAGTHRDEQTYENVAELAKLVHVTAKRPQTFLAVTQDDKMHGAQAALLFVELKRAGVPAESHCRCEKPDIPTVRLVPKDARTNRPTGPKPLSL
jgi:hypothetical protein